MSKIPRQRCGPLQPLRRVVGRARAKMVLVVDGVRRDAEIDVDYLDCGHQVPH